MTLQERFDRVGGLAPVKGDHFNPLSEAEIVSLEGAVGGALPPFYRSFLLTFGASSFRKIVEFSPVRRLPPSVSSDGRGFVDVLYGAAADHPNDLGGMLDLYRARMPEHFLPIAGDGGGNQIAMLVGGDHSGTIYYWDHNNEWDEEDYVEDDLPVPSDLKWQNVTVIAASFDAFLDCISVREQPGQVA
ncbi:MAG TPA: SMI1/KNR4 family protein [Kofleriaceae bacterium]|nr:SMI1/KNR4 family protein [Kofleriaceae bacterium]